MSGTSPLVVPPGGSLPAASLGLGSGAIESLGLGSRAIESLGLAGVAEAVGAVLVPAVAAGADDPAPPHAVTTRPRTGIMTSRRRLLVEVGCIWRDLALAVPESAG